MWPMATVLDSVGLAYDRYSVNITMTWTMGIIFLGLNF